MESKCDSDKDCLNKGMICRQGMCVLPGLLFDPCHFNPSKQSCADSNAGGGLKCSYFTGICNDPRKVSSPLSLFCSTNADCQRGDFCCFASSVAGQGVSTATNKATLMANYQLGKGHCRRKKKLFQGCGSLFFDTELVLGGNTTAPNPLLARVSDSDKILFEECERPYKCSPTHRICVPTCQSDADCRVGIFSNRPFVKCNPYSNTCEYTQPPEKLFVETSSEDPRETLLSVRYKLEKLYPTHFATSPSLSLIIGVSVGLILFVVAVLVIWLYYRRKKRRAIHNVDISAIPSPFPASQRQSNVGNYDEDYKDPNFGALSFSPDFSLPTSRAEGIAAESAMYNKPFPSSPSSPDKTT